MSVEGLSPSQVEQDRQRLARELSSESGEDWLEGYRPGSAGCQELLDRTALLTDLLERHLPAHPGCIAQPGWYLLAEQATAASRELYQQVGAAHLAVEEPTAQGASGEGPGTA
jgi:hypothetical protein